MSRLCPTCGGEKEFHAVEKAIAETKQGVKVVRFRICNLKEVNRPGTRAATFRRKEIA
jgi:hypothetical protein